MCSRQCVFAAILLIVFLLPDQSSAQMRTGGRARTGGGMMGGRPESGGRMQQRGAFGMNEMMSRGGCSEDGTAAEGTQGMGMRAAMMQRMSRFGRQNAGENASGAALSTQSSANLMRLAQQFTQTAGRFDRDNDQQLNAAELSQVAAAVIDELQSGPRESEARESRARRTSSMREQVTDRRTATRGPSEMTRQFVRRAMTFDRDGNGSLNAEETQQMALALIRSLG